MPPRASTSRPAMALLFGLALLGLAEGGARLFGVEAAYQADQVGGWRVISGSESVLFGNDITGPHAFLVTTNPDGLRSTVARPRVEGRPRVAVMGDSTVFGWGVGDQETVADGLAEGLRYLSGGVEVLNAGQPGYSTVQAARLFTSVVAHYQPDLTILFLPQHDYNRVLVSDTEHLRGASTPLGGLRVWLASRSRLYELLRRMLFPLARQAVDPNNEQAVSPDQVPRVSDAERTRAVDEMREAMASWGDRLALGILPSRLNIVVETTPPKHRGEDWARQWSQERGAPFFDLRDCCIGGGEALTLAHDPGHLSGEGNRQVGLSAAAGVAAALLQQREPAP